MPLIHTVLESSARREIIVYTTIAEAARELIPIRISAVLPSVHEALEKGAIVVVEDGRHRVRHLPIADE